MNGTFRPGHPNESGDRDDSGECPATAGSGGPAASVSDSASAPGGDRAQGSEASVRLTAWVRGRVQGVGFRWWTRAAALEIGGLTGFASNLEDGRVQVVAEGTRERCERLLDRLRRGATPGRVDGVAELWGEPRGGYEGFRER